MTSINVGAAKDLVEYEGRIIDGANWLTYESRVLYNFKCTEFTDDDGELRYTIETKINNLDFKPPQVLTNTQSTLIDAVAVTCDAVNKLDEEFGYNNYIKFLFNKWMLTTLLDLLLNEQMKHDTIRPKHQLSFKLNNGYLDAVIHNKEIVPDSYINLLSKCDGGELSNIYSYKQSGFYLSNYERGNTTSSIVAYRNKADKSDSTMECLQFSTNIIMHESRKIFEKMLSNHTRESIKAKDIYINIGNNNQVQSNNKEAKCIVISSFIKFDAIMEKDYSNFTVFLADPLPFELSYGQLDI